MTLWPPPPDAYTRACAKHIYTQTRTKPNILTSKQAWHHQAYSHVAFAIADIFKHGASNFSFSNEGNDGISSSSSLLPRFHSSTMSNCHQLKKKSKLNYSCFSTPRNLLSRDRHHVTLPKPRELCHSLLLLPKLIVCYHCCCCYFDAILYAQPFGLG